MQLRTLELVVEAKGAVLAFLNGRGALQLVGVQSHQVEVVVLLVLRQDAYKCLKAKLDCVGVFDGFDFKVHSLVAVEQTVIQEHGLVGRVVDLQGFN